jgi:hypothetical protein
MKVKQFMPGMKIKMMLNSFCSPDCIAYIHHHIETSNFEKKKDGCYFSFVCTQHAENPLKKNFILPHEINDYDYIDTFKISGREFYTKSIEFIIDKYVKRESIGYNLYVLLDGFKYVGAYLEMKESINRSDMIQNCKYDCFNCQYCDSILTSNFEKR